MLLAAVFCIGTQTAVLHAQREDRNGTIMGTVLDTSGKPIPSDIMIYRWTIVNGRANPGAICSTQTDADGHYQCHHLPFGSFIISSHSLAPIVVALPVPASSKTSAPPLSASSQPAAPQKSVPQEAYPLTFYPGVTDLDSAEKVILIKDGTATADIMVHAMPVHDIRGIFPSRPSDPEIELKAHVGFLNLSTPYSATYEAVTGQFIFKSVPDGAYEVIADWATQAGPHHGQALVDLLVHYSKMPAPRLPSTITIANKDVSQRPYTADVGPDGSFSIPSVTDGEYELSVENTNGAYVHSVTTAGREVSPLKILIMAGQRVDALDVELGTSTATVSGILNVEQVFPDETGVVLQPVGSHQAIVAMADDQGEFRLRNLPPGSYRLYAWDDLKDVEYKNPLYLSKFQNKSTNLTVDENAPITQLKLTAIDADR
jgi:hypothetical protein